MIRPVYENYYFAAFGQQDYEKPQTLRLNAEYHFRLIHPVFEKD